MQMNDISRRLTVLQLCQTHPPRLDEALARCLLLTREQAVVALTTDRDEQGFAALHNALANDASMGLVLEMYSRVKGGLPELNLFAILNDMVFQFENDKPAEKWNAYPLHSCAAGCTDVEVLKFAISKFPYALTKRNYGGRTPLDSAKYWHTDRPNHAAIVRCLEEHTLAWPNLLNQTIVKCCLVELKRQGMTAYVAVTPLDALTPPQFVFKLLDEFVNREMRLLANEILSYVGANVGSD